MPAPCAMVAARFAPNCRRRRAADADADRAASASNFSRLPSPTTRTRLAGNLPSVWITADSPSLPVISLSAMSDETAPPERRVRRPRPPAGRRHALEKIDDDGVSFPPDDVALRRAHDGH